MPPAQQTNQREDGFTPKYRQFHPLSRVWVQNPFSHDVVFQVADEHNRPYKYRMVAGKVSELPGGAIATLGVKAIVDELIQNNKDDEMRMWDANVRSKHEGNIILRIKESSPMQDSTTPGEIDLSVKTKDVPEASSAAPAAPEEAFPGLNQPVGTPTAPVLAPLPHEAAAGVANIVSASLPSSNAIVEG